MPFCSKCGFQVEGVDNFCAKCGFKLKYKGKVKEIKRHPKARKSFWRIAKSSLRNAFFDSDEKMSSSRKAVNIVLIIAILMVGISIAAPYLDEIQINFDNKNHMFDENGDCRFRLDATQISFSSATYFPDRMAMEMLITNNKDEDIVLESLAKTYEFRFDNMGDTEHEPLSMVVPAGRTLKLSFSVKKEPHILGLEFSNCEKSKVSSWQTVSN